MRERAIYENAISPRQESFYARVKAHECSEVLHYRKTVLSAFGSFLHRNNKRCSVIQDPTPRHCLGKGLGELQ